MEHPLDDRAVPSGGFAPDPAARDAVLRLDEWEDLLSQVVVVPSGRARVDVLIAADFREAVDHRDDQRSHLARPDEPVEPGLQVLAERIKPEERLAGPRVADNPIRRGISLAGIVPGRQIDRHVPTGRIPQRISLQDFGIQRFNDDFAARHAPTRRGTRVEAIKAAFRRSPRAAVARCGRSRRESERSGWRSRMRR